MERYAILILLLLAGCMTELETISTTEEVQTGPTPRPALEATVDLDVVTKQ